MAGPYEYLKDTERRELAQIIERCTAGTDRDRARTLLQHVYADVRHARDSISSLRSNVTHIRNQIRTAEDRAEDWRKAARRSLHEQHNAERNSRTAAAQAEAAYAFANEMADYCSPHNIASDYAKRLVDRLNRAATSTPENSRG